MPNSEHDPRDDQANTGIPPWQHRPPAASTISEKLVRRCRRAGRSAAYIGSEHRCKQHHRENPREKLVGMPSAARSVRRGPPAGNSLLPGHVCDVPTAETTRVLARQPASCHLLRTCHTTPLLISVASRARLVGIAVTRQFTTVPRHSAAGIAEADASASCAMLRAARSRGETSLLTQVSGPRRPRRRRRDREIASFQVVTFTPLSGALLGPMAAAGEMVRSPPRPRLGGTAWASSMSDVSPP